MTCDKDGCTKCEDGNGPKSGSTSCKACTSTPAGLKTCTSDLATADTCDDGYGNITGTCTECTVKFCMNCNGGVA